MKIKERFGCQSTLMDCNDGLRGASVFYHVRYTIGFNLRPQIKKSVHSGHNNSYNGLRHVSQLQSPRGKIVCPTLQIKMCTIKLRKYSTAQRKLTRKTALIVPSSGFTCFYLVSYLTQLQHKVLKSGNSLWGQSSQTSLTTATKKPG